MVKETNKIDFIEFPAQDVKEIASVKRFYGELWVVVQRLGGRLYRYKK